MVAGSLSSSIGRTINNLSPYDNSLFYQRTGFSSFGEIAASFYPQLYRRAMKLTRCPHDAEDLVQDTFERALTQFDKFNPDFNNSKANMGAWLSTLQYHLFVNRYRREQRAQEILYENGDFLAETTFSSYGQDDPGVLVSDADFRENGLPKVQEKLGEIMIKPEFVEVFLAVEYAGMSYRQAAEHFGVPLGTIMSRVYRGRCLVQEYLFGTGIVTELPTGRRTKTRFRLRSPYSLDERVEHMMLN